MQSLSAGEISLFNIILQKHWKVHVSHTGFCPKDKLVLHLQTSHCGLILKRDSCCGHTLQKSKHFKREKMKQGSCFTFSHISIGHKKFNVMTTICETPKKIPRII